MLQHLQLIKPKKIYKIDHYENGSYGCGSALVDCPRHAVFSVSSNLAKRPGNVEDGRRARVGAKKGTLRIFRVFFFFPLFQKETRKTAAQASSLNVGSLN